MGPTYSIRRLDRLEAWFEDHATDEKACAAMKLWVGELMRSPKQICNGALEHQGRKGRRVYFAAVPGTGAMVTYMVGDAPLRVVTILSVIPAP